MWRELQISHALLKISLFVFKASPASQKSEIILQLTRRAHLVNRQSCKRRETTNELVRQTTRSEQRDQTSGPLAHPVNCLSPIIERYSVPECSVLSLQFVHNSTAVKVNAYKMFTCSRGFVLQSDWVRQIQAPKSTAFYANVTRLSPPPVFRGESLGPRLPLSHTHHRSVPALTPHPPP